MSHNEKSVILVGCMLMAVLMAVVQVVFQSGPTETDTAELTALAVSDIEKLSQSLMITQKSHE